MSRQVIGLGARESCGRVKETRAQKPTDEFTCQKEEDEKKNGIESFLGARVLFPVGSAFPVFENLKKTRQVMDFYMYFEPFLETYFSRLKFEFNLIL